MAAASGEMVWARVLEEGVFRFDASEAARAAAAPSLSFADPRRREAPREGSDAPAVIPTCQVAVAAVGDDVQEVVVKVRYVRRLHPMNVLYRSTCDGSRFPHARPPPHNNHRLEKQPM